MVWRGDEVGRVGILDFCGFFSGGTVFSCHDIYLSSGDLGRNLVGELMQFRPSSVYK